MSPENLEWSQTNSIQMSVQTADLFLLNKSQNEQLNLSCTLLTIARGKCNVEIKPQIETPASISNEQQRQSHHIGRRYISNRKRGNAECIVWV